MAKDTKKAENKETTQEQNDSCNLPPESEKPKKTPKSTMKKNTGDKTMNTQIEKVENDQIILEKEISPNCKVKYTVSPKAHLKENAVAVATKKVSKEISIPGFRKGKAPKHLIMKNHKHQIEQETDSALADICFKESQNEAKTPVLQSNNNVSFHTEGENEEKKFIFSFECEPTVPDLNPADFKLKEIEKEEIDDTRIEKEIDQVRSFYANWEQVEDRPIEDGDFLVLDIEDLDQDPPVKVFNGARFEVTKGKMTPWMLDMVLGKNKGDSVEGISKPDKTASEEDKKNFKEKKVRITILTIEKSTLPTLDDELAKKVGAKSIEEMRENLKNLVAIKSERERMESLRKDLEQKLIKKVSFEIPGSLLEKEANHRMSQLMSQKEFKNKWDKEFTDTEKEEKKEEIKERSKEAICLFYLCRDIVNKNKISVTQKDVEGSYDSVLEMMYGDQKTLQYQSMNDEQKQMALTQVMIHKAQDHIINSLEQEDSLAKK